MRARCRACERRGSSVPLSCLYYSPRISFHSLRLRTLHRFPSPVIAVAVFLDHLIVHGRRPRVAKADESARASERSATTSAISALVLLSLFVLTRSKHSYNRLPRMLHHSSQQYAVSPLDLSLLSMLTADNLPSSSALPQPRPAHRNNTKYTDRRPPVDPLMVAAASSAGPE